MNNRPSFRFTQTEKTDKSLWRPLAKTIAPIRSITATVGGRLLGGRIEGDPSALFVWASDTEGKSWFRLGKLSEPPKGAWGDEFFLCDGSKTVYCTHREEQKGANGENWRILLHRSDDAGKTWKLDSVVAESGSKWFIGAPFLRFDQTGALQCVYDSEVDPAQAGYKGTQWIMQKTRASSKLQTAWTDQAVVACRPKDIATFARDGMPTVASLGGKTLVLVCEGVDPTERATNRLYAVLSRDDGKTWDLTTRREILAPRKNGALFNAYCPYIVRTAQNQAAIAYCTDDDFPTPSRNFDPPHIRNAHIKFVRLTVRPNQPEPFQVSEPETIEAGQPSMYQPGLFVLRDALLCTVNLYKEQAILARKLR